MADHAGCRRSLDRSAPFYGGMVYKLYSAKTVSTHESVVLSHGAQLTLIGAGVIRRRIVVVWLEWRRRVQLLSIPLLRCEAMGVHPGVSKA